MFLLLFVIFLSHFFYALIWYKPKLFKKKIKPIITFSHLLKFLQFYLIYDKVKDYPFNQNIYQIYLFFILFVVGQTLNIMVYIRLGNIGVYYGNKIGYTTKWIKAFPYNLGISNPQYIGCIISLLSLFILFPFIDIAIISLYWISLYIVTCIIENEYTFSNKKNFFLTKFCSG